MVPDRSPRISTGQHSSVKCQGHALSSYAPEGLRKGDFFRGNVMKKTGLGHSEKRAEFATLVQDFWAG